MRCSVNIPNLGDFADPRVVADVARLAEDAGWDGLFIWDHLIGYNQDLGAAMKYAFGNAFICRVRQFCAFCVRQHACALHSEQSLDMRLWQGFVRKASALNAAMPCLCSQE